MLAGIRDQPTWGDADGTRRVHALDAESVIKSVESHDTRTSTVRTCHREADGHTIHQIEVERKKRGGSGAVEIEWVKGHAGIKHQEKVDRAAARAAFRTTHAAPRFEEDNVNPFHLLYYECVVHPDVRKHVTRTMREARHTEWCGLKTQGRMARWLRTHPSENMPLNRKPAPNNTSRFYNKFVSEVLPTPYTKQRNKGMHNHECPICGAPKADLAHIVLDCTHERLEKRREELDASIRKLIINKRSTLSGEQQYFQHPIANVDQNKLYPYTNGIPEEGIGYHLEGLPESRLYRNSNTRANTITVTHPDTNSVKEYRPVRRVPTTTFWALVAWHQVTHSQMPRKRRAYDQRARDIWEAITRAKETSGEASVCYATGRELLDILADECKSSTELFCNILNTHLGFAQRRTLEAHAAFATRAGLNVDGLDETAYVHSVYGNPPYDGTTIEKTLNIAEGAAERPGFRAIYFIPLTDKRRQARMQHHTATILMEFPNDTVPFIPDAYWYGESGRKITRGTGCYKEKHTRLYLIMYESADLEDLPPINYDTLHTRLAEWYLPVLPKKHNNKETLQSTRVPMQYFDKVQSDEYRLPMSWRFWNRRVGHGAGYGRCSNSYEGAAMDSYSMKNAAVREVIGWDPMVSIAGALPGNFKEFLRKIANPADKVGDITKKVGHALREHGKNIYAEYNKLVKETESRGKTSDARDPTSGENETTQWGNQTLTNLCYYDQMRQDFDRL